MRHIARCISLLVAVGLIFAGCDSPTAPQADESRTSSQATANAGGPPGGTPGGGPAAPPQSCDVTVPDDFSTIGGAVGAASSGDKVCVKEDADPNTPGTQNYVEQVLINKDLTLKGTGDPDPTIEAPPSPDQFTIPESGLSLEPVVFAFGGTEAGGAISGSGTVDVSVSGFHVDGANKQPGGDRLAGILFRNVQSSGGIAANTVDGLANGGQRNFGIAVYGDSDAKIYSNTVTGYERVGIFVTGGEGGPAPTGKIRGNTVDAEVSGKWAPNGIQIGGGAQGDVVNNTVKNNVHPAAAAGGVLVVESDGIEVRGNTIDNNDNGVGVFTFFSVGPSVDNNRVIQNEITQANTWGVLVGTFASGTTANNNKVTNNTITCDATPNDDDEGVFIWAFSGTAVNNKVIANTITECEDPLQDTGGDESKVQANSPAMP